MKQKENGWEDDKKIYGLESQKSKPKFIAKL